jgi:uncharacterized protein (DUF362 family)
MERPSGPEVAARRGAAARARVHVSGLEGGYEACVEEGLAFAGFFEEVPAGGTVFLKPNLTFPEYRPGVTTSIECIAAVTRLLIARGYRVIIGEADSGGYNRFSMDAVFASTGVDTLARETGARLVNVSFTEPETLTVRSGWRRLAVRVPRLLMHEIDAFVSLPVPKIHMNTLVSLSIKNQWGCIQEPDDRLRLHPHFAPVMLAINRSLPRPYAVIDGRFGLNRSGPMDGDPVRLDWLLVSNDLVAADRAGCRLMQVAEGDVGFLRHFRAHGWWPAWDEVERNADLAPFLREPFHLQRRLTDLPGAACFNNSLLAWIGYHSPLAGPLHRLLYLFRKPFYDYAAERARVRGRSGDHDQE